MAIYTARVLKVNRGILIAVEGLDGSGLTTHSRLLVLKLVSQGYRSVYTKEPTNGPIGNIIRQFLATGSDHSTLALLFAADRLWHYTLDPALPGGGIKGALERGYIVVSDRYKYSSLAYQGTFAGYEWVKLINSRAPEADIIVYIDTSIEVNLSRLGLRSRRELYESRERLTMIKRTFEKVLEEAERQGSIVIRVQGSSEEGERPTDDVSRDIFDGVISAIRRLY